jgi:hypothetical protein
MDAKKGKTRKESTPIKVWVTPEEKASIAAKADAHCLSSSGYLRRLGLALPVESTIDQRAILDLVRSNADLGRFGGLIKMWLTRPIYSIPKARRRGWGSHNRQWRLDRYHMGGARNRRDAAAEHARQIRSDLSFTRFAQSRRKSGCQNVARDRGAFLQGARLR